MHHHYRTLIPLVALNLMSLCIAPALAQTPVALQNATATFSQDTQEIGQAIDGDYGNINGWAVHPHEDQNATAVFQTIDNNVGSPGGSLLTFNLFQDFNYQVGGNFNGFLMRDFRLSVTTADRSTFADGKSTGGNVGDPSIWTVLNPLSATSLNGSTLTVQSDGSVIDSGTLPPTETYTITASTNLTNITGFRLEALTDNGGKVGYGTGVGNFVLTEFTVGVAPSPVPESRYGLGILLCTASVAILLRRKRIA